MKAIKLAKVLLSMAAFAAQLTRAENATTQPSPEVAFTKVLSGDKLLVILRTVTYTRLGPAPVIDLSNAKEPVTIPPSRIERITLKLQKGLESSDLRSFNLEYADVLPGSGSLEPAKFHDIVIDSGNVIMTIEKGSEMFLFFGKISDPPGDGSRWGKFITLAHGTGLEPIVFDSCRIDSIQGADVSVKLVVASISPPKSDRIVKVLKFRLKDGDLEPVEGEK